MKAPKKKLETLFVVDGNWYLHRAFYTLKTRRPYSEALPYHFLGMIVKDALVLKARYLLVAFDGPKVFRHKVYPLYKVNREADMKVTQREEPDEEDLDEVGEGDVQKPSVKDIYDFLPNVFDLLTKVGVAYYQPRRREADDVLCSIARRYSIHSDDPPRVPVVSFVGGCQDKDAYQYVIGPHVRLHDTSAKGADGKPKPKTIDEATVLAKTGLRSDQQVDYQTLIGDGVDGIPKIKGFTPARVKKILKKYGTLRRWYSRDKEAKAELDPLMVDLRRNRKLVTLTEDALPPGEPSDWMVPKKKPKDPYLSKNYHEYHLFLWPKSKGLFARR